MSLYLEIISFYAIKPHSLNHSLVVLMSTVLRSKIHNIERLVDNEGV
jgi:hypothetical protein